MELSERKKALRLEIATRMQQFTAQDQRVAGELLAKQFTSSPHVVALFKSMRDEIDMQPLIDKLLAQNTKLFFPDFENIIWDDVDMLLIPGIAFDKQGHRLGRGGGYYDRLLEKLEYLRPKLVVIGVCMPCQFVDEIPIEAHDKKVDLIISSTSSYHF